ncbi:hypothetical protein QFW96_14570 [Saccharopolyspora sp. TS4A08]|uniref:DUF4254 domain-containing protein n=1 Tax=Saccharopolyspora ipomoeae TaxID=3042027 RepID=A0ABT6PPB2_9PSEU|nr:hypothetical protein [Saccharopolyspora sp. TS4A08]MDI2029852.1 hypothetical protein [Saccharopolyspora sp. TS4A08]
MDLGIRNDVRTDLTQLIDLASLLVWSDDDNKCGVRHHTEDQKKALDAAEERLALHGLGQHIAGAGEWLEEPHVNGDAFADAMDLPLIAFNVAAGCSEPVRSVLGEIIARESVVGLWNEHTSTSPLQVFDAWAEQVRAVSIRLAGAFRHRHNTTAKPWSP